MFVIDFLKEMETTKSLISFYSSVVNNVIEEISQQSTGLEENVINQIKQTWLSEYASIAGIELDLFHEEQSDSDENDNQEQNNVHNMIF